jgi:phosphatidate cytidylyltransferase
VFAGLTPNVQVALVGVFALLALSSLAVAAVGRLVAGADFTELRLRVRSWWIMVAVLCLAALLGRAVSLVFLALVSFLALKEYLSLVPTRRADRGVLLWAYAAIPIQYAWIASERYEMFIIFVPLYALFLVPTNMAVIGATEGFLRAAGTVSFGLMATVYTIGHLGYLLVLPAAGNPGGGSAGLAVYLVFLAQFNDVVQYLCGKVLGRRKVVPRVSPNKTWEGLIGGLLVTVVLAALLAPWLTPLAGAEAVAAGMLIGTSGFAGDLTMSAIKRDLGVKDTGTLLAGHGGILDRVDSLIFAAPLFFHFVYHLHY